MTARKTSARRPATKPMGGSRTYGRLQAALDTAAQREIQAALRETDGQIVAAAKLLGISKVALWKRIRALKALGLRVEP
jgi:transcriptional regulator of acetoin/glycerol metabolism